jgi:hypothetical protein
MTRWPVRSLCQIAAVQSVHGEADRGRGTPGCHTGSPGRRVTFDDDSTAIVYIWDDAENYWPTTQAGEEGNHADPFSPASGIETTMARLAEALDAMQRHQGPRFGKVALIDKGGASEGSSCEQVVLDRALDDLTEAASRDTRLTRSRDRLETVVRNLATAVRPRSQYGLIHGELGPDHVLVDRHGHRRAQPPRGARLPADVHRPEFVAATP